jgi:hypothetical protein
MSELRFSDAGEGISGVVSRRCPSLECLELEHIAGVEALTLRSESLLSLRLASVSHSLVSDGSKWRPETSAECEWSTASTKRDPVVPGTAAARRR